jgi:hypothetical protein
LDHFMLFLECKIFLTFVHKICLIKVSKYSSYI